MFPIIGTFKTRGHGLQVRERTLKEGYEAQTLHKAVSIWNELPGAVVMAGTVSTFERHLDCYIKEQGLEGYGNYAGKWDQHGWHRWQSVHFHGLQLYDNSFQNQAKNFIM